jgi:hypothetical protein
VYRENVMEIKIAEKEIKSLVDVEIGNAIAKALGESPDTLIKSVVNVAMSQKKSSYDNKTIFQAAVETMIEDKAREVFKAWLKKKEGLIKKALEARLRKEGSEFIESIADQVVSGLSKSFYVRCSLKVED